jgi:hypothetical protein
MARSWAIVEKMQVEDRGIQNTVKGPWSSRLGDQRIYADIHHSRNDKLSPATGHSMRSNQMLFSTKRRTSSVD